MQNFGVLPVNVFICHRKSILEKLEIGNKDMAWHKEKRRRFADLAN
jgi:hypothetical protein